MSTNQKYSGRIHARRQLVSIDNHLTSAIKLLTDIGEVYLGAEPKISMACVELIKVLGLCTPMVTKIRDNI